MSVSLPVPVAMAKLDECLPPPPPPSTSSADPAKSSSTIKSSNKSLKCPKCKANALPSLSLSRSTMLVCFGR